MKHIITIDIDINMYVHMDGSVQLSNKTKVVHHIKLPY